MKKIIIFFKGIWNFLNSRVFLYILLIIAFLFIAKTCSDYREEKREHNIDEQNYEAAHDSLRIERTKSGALEVSISEYILSEKELKEQNSALYKEIKDEKGKVVSLAQIVLQLKQDSVNLRKHINYLESLMSQPIQINDSTYSMDWEMRYDWDTVNYDVYKGRTYIGAKIKDNFIWEQGMTSHDLLTDGITFKHYKTELLSKTSQIKLTFGQRVEDNKLRVFVKTDYPGFTPQSLQGVLIDPNTSPYMKELMKKKKWFPNTWSVGGGPSFGYNILTGKPYIGVGVNVNYTIFQW